MKRHASEQPLGHLQHFERRGGRRLQLARYRPFVQAEPYVHDVRRTVIEIVAGVVILNAWALGLVLWYLILTVQKPPVLP